MRRTVNLERRFDILINVRLNLRLSCRALSPIRRQPLSLIHRLILDDNHVIVCCTLAFSIPEQRSSLRSWLVSGGKGRRVADVQRGCTSAL